MPIAAGDISLGRQELRALLGATQDSFAQAATVRERLCLVPVCPNSVRAAHERDMVTTAQATGTAPPAAQDAPPRMYRSMDGVVAHVHDAGWKEITVGCVYTTRTRAPRHRPETLGIQAEQQSDLAALTDADTFGWRLWAEACRRGVTERSEVVVIGDGAHWIGDLAAAHFPQATQIVDWDHARQYVWRAAATSYGATRDLRLPWARQHLAALWDGQVADVLARWSRIAPRTRGSLTP